MSRMRGAPTLGPYSRTDSRPGRLTDSGSTLIAPATPSMSKVSTTAHLVSPGQIPLTRHLLAVSRRSPATPFDSLHEFHSRRMAVIAAKPDPLHRLSREGGNPEGMGSRLHGNDERTTGTTGTTGGGAALLSSSRHKTPYTTDGERRTPCPPRVYRIGATRTGRRRAWRRRSRSGAALPCRRASPDRRHRRSAPACAPSCRSASGSRPS